MEIRTLKITEKETKKFKQFLEWVEIQGRKSQKKWPANPARTRSQATHSSSTSVPHSKSSLKIFFEEGKNLWIDNWKLLTIISAIYIFYRAFFKLKIWYLLSVCMCMCGSMRKSEDIWGSVLTFHHVEAGSYCFCHSANWLVNWPISLSLSYLSEHWD